jgi:hypothetical protein
VAVLLIVTVAAVSLTEVGVMVVDFSIAVINHLFFVENFS